MQYIDSYYSRTIKNTGKDTSKTEALKENLTVEVCVIGGGLAGVSTALGLAERGCRVALLEQNKIGWGASGRNGGFVASGFSQNALVLIDQLGLDHAKRLYQLTQDAYDLIQQRIIGAEAEIKSPQQGTVTASWFNDPKGLQNYIDTMNSVFGESFEYWPKEKINEAYLTDRYFCGYLERTTSHFQSLNYTIHTAELAAESGAKIFEHTPALKVTGHDTESSRWKVTTPEGEINANHVVYACSGYIDSLHPKLSRATLPVATYVLLTEPLGDRLSSAIQAPYAVSDNRFSSNYYRVVQKDRLLWGGRVSMFHPSQEALKHIMLNDLLSVYPQLKGVKGEVAWGGYMGYARHKMPQLGQLKPGEWYCQGFGGHGMATTTMGGELIASAIANDDKTWLDFKTYGLEYVGKPFGPAIAQLAYWSYQIQDAIRAKRLN
ncbi:MAG: gamma-glutamylputrescine oxidase [Candidatus Azotimanducaceae bacterium]|jgi:gamma-glutamylputrescine oxidase